MKSSTAASKRLFSTSRAPRPEPSLRPEPGGARSPEAAEPAARLPVIAEVIDVEGEDSVILVSPRLHEVPILAELAVPHYTPAPGDRVLAQPSDDGWFVIGILGDARRRPSRTPGLTTAVREDGGVDLRANEGDLVLSAKGRVVLRADAEVQSIAPEVTVETTSMRVLAGRHEVRAERMIEHAGDVYRHAEGLVEVTADRARTLVAKEHDLCAGRTTITSDTDTTVDGKRVLLG